jgi:hypothetical protein
MVAAIVGVVGAVAGAYGANQQKKAGEAAAAAGQAAAQSGADAAAATAAAGLEAAKMATGLGQEQLAEARRQYDLGMGVIKPVVDAQVGIMKETLKQGQEQYEYSKGFRPLEGQMLEVAGAWKGQLEADMKEHAAIRDRTAEHANALRLRTDWYDDQQMKALDMLTGGDSKIIGKYGAEIEGDVGRAVADARAGQAQAQNSAIRQAMRYGLSVPAATGALGVQQASQLAAAANNTRQGSIANYRGLVAQGIGLRDQGFRTSQTAMTDALARDEAAHTTARSMRIQDEGIKWARGLDMAGLGRGIAGASQGAYGLATSAGTAAAQNQMGSSGVLMNGMNGAAQTTMQGQQLALQGQQAANSAMLQGQQIAMQGIGYGSQGIDMSGIGAGLGMFAKAYGQSGSSRAYKQGIVRIGTHASGVGIYSFEYAEPYRAKWGAGRHIGVMADELAAVMPGALSVDADGHTVVDYSML